LSLFDILEKTQAPSAITPEFQPVSEVTVTPEARGTMLGETTVLPDEIKVAEVVTLEEKVVSIEIKQ